MDERLKALLEGLRVPNPEWWNDKPIESLRELGKCIVEKASGLSVESIQAADRIVDTMNCE